MWDERFAAVCERHPDLVAVYESAHGRLGLLLRQTLVPLGVERVEWLAETRGVTRRLIDDLRAHSFTGGVVVLQWLPIDDVARIVARWIRRWDGDSARRSELLAVADRRMADEQFLSEQHSKNSARSVARAATTALDDAGLAALKAWYETMAPCWLAIQPAQRRRLVLQTHVWLASRVLEDVAEGPARAILELGPEGPLTQGLQRLLPRSDLPRWRRWIGLVRADLARALARPPARRTQAWARWLFLIPYSIPVPRRPQLRLVTGGERSAVGPA